MKPIAKNRTAIIIAHRLRAIRGADRIIVMDQGRVVEQGTHAALMAARGVYWGLNGDG
jgi:ABC-type multidrug transport system fused ATPase/permease subunit